MRVLASGRTSERPWGHRDPSLLFPTHKHKGEADFVYAVSYIRKSGKGVIIAVSNFQVSTPKSGQEYDRAGFLQVVAVPGADHEGFYACVQPHVDPLESSLLLIYDVWGEEVFMGYGMCPSYFWRGDKHPGVGGVFPGQFVIAVHALVWLCHVVQGCPGIEPVVEYQHPGAKVGGVGMFFVWWWLCGVDKVEVSPADIPSEVAGLCAEIQVPGTAQPDMSGIDGVDVVVPYHFALVVAGNDQSEAAIGPWGIHIH